MKQRSAHFAEFEEDLAIRLNDMELSRAVEQTAILIALYSEVQASNVKRNTAAKHALAFLLGYLSHAWCRGTIVHQDHHYRATREAQDVWAALERAGSPVKHEGDTAEGTGGFGAVPFTAVRDWGLDFVVSPLDGVRAFLDGRDSGTISVLAGGRRGSFVPDEAHDLAEDYLVVAVNPATLEKGTPLLSWLLGREGQTLLRRVGPLISGRETVRVRLDELRERIPVRGSANAETNRGKTEGGLLLRAFLEELVTHLGDLPTRHQVRSWATSTNRPRDFAFRFIRPALRSFSKPRTFNGSSVAAGLSVFFPHLSLDGYLGVIRRTHAILLAVAARARGSTLVAIPVRQTEPEDYELIEDKPVLAGRDFFRDRNPDIFLVATGITENLLLEGVRFQPTAPVSTHTLCLRTRTRSSRFISHHHDLDEKRFRFLQDSGFLRQFLANVEEGKGLELRTLYRFPRTDRHAGSEGAASASCSSGTEANSPRPTS